jgi:hypothetical protein
MTPPFVPAVRRSRPGPPRLGQLSRFGREAHARCGSWNWRDDLAHLSEARRATWCRVLSSVATTEALEKTLIEPILEGLRADADAADYLATHATDEVRHHQLLARYLRNTFGYRKKKRTAADRVLYDGILPRVARRFRSKPAYGLALLHCYERFSLTFYERLRREAQADGAQNLLTLIRAIERDELRHVAGMEALLDREVEKRGGRLSALDRAAVAGILRLMLVDVDMRPWALHNRELRGHLVRLGFDPAGLVRAAQEAARETQRRL